MLKLPSSIYNFLFATFLVFFCFNGQQLVYATNLVLDKDHLNAIVEVSKVDSSQTPATGSSTATHSFDLDFDIGDVSNYPSPGKSFKLAIGKSCNLNVKIWKEEDVNDKMFRINRVSITELKSLTITNEKVTTKSSVNGQRSSIFCAPQDSNDGGGGSIVLENPANDPSKSTIELTISGNDIKNLPTDFKLTSDAQIYVSPNSSGGKGDGSNGNGNENGSMSEKEKLGKKLGIMFFSIGGVSLTILTGVIIYLSMKKCKCDDDDETENKKGNKKKKRKNESKV